MTVGLSFPVPQFLPSKNQRSVSSDTKPKSSNALHVYVEKLSQGLIIPTKSLLISTLRYCSLIQSISHAKSIHAHIFKFGFGQDRFIGSFLVWFYSSNGFPNFARRVFDGVIEKDAALCTSMLLGYAKNNDIFSARKVFDEMLSRDVVAWNAMLSGYLRCRLPVEAIEFFREMHFSDVTPNEVTFTVILSACAQLGCLQLGETIHAHIKREMSDAVRVAPELYNSIVHMYAKCGRLEVAFRLFLEKEGEDNLELWNTMLTGFAVHGYGMAATSLFAQMIKKGIIPDRITFLGLLMACSHTGYTGNAWTFFDSMGRKYGLEPGPEHYGCMVDVLSRAGHLEEACLLANSMPFDIDAYVLGALLSGCYVHQNYELGLKTAGRLLELQPEDESRYVALINLCMLTGRRHDAIEIRNLMISRGVKTSAAVSSIEVNGHVYEFVASDVSHCRSKETYEMLKLISRESEEGVSALY